MPALSWVLDVGGLRLKEGLEAGGWKAGGWMLGAGTMTRARGVTRSRITTRARIMARRKRVTIKNCTLEEIVFISWVQLRAAMN